LKTPTNHGKKAAFSYWPASNRTNPDKVVMGYTIQTNRYRYTEWIRKSSGAVLARDLFDHQIDPDETRGIANDDENEDLIQELSVMLDDGWRKIAKDIR
jgi:iduronate 2-sulfatase